MARILNLETSSYVCSVAYAEEGNVIAYKENKEGRSHATLLTVFIQQIMKELNLNIKDLDAISVSKGPGSYTGLRIGVSAAKGLCYGASIPLISIGSLHSMAYGVLHTPEFFDIVNKSDHPLLCPMIDARRMEVYTAFYNLKADPITETKAIVVDNETFKESLEDHTLIFFGDGAEKCKPVIEHSNALFISNFDPSARFMSYLSENAYLNKKFEDTAYFEPFYLKDFVPTTPKKNILR